MEHQAHTVCRALAVIALTLALANGAAADSTAPVGLYGRPVAQPYFDFPYWARFSDCRPWPLAWGYDPFPNYSPVDCQGLDVPTVSCLGDFVAHRPSIWYASADFVPLTVDYGSNTIIARPFVPFFPGVDNSNPPDGDVIDAVDVPPIPAHFGTSRLSSGSLRPEFDAGGKFTVGARIFDCYRLEGTYLGSYSWRSSAIARSSLGDLGSVLAGFFIADEEAVNFDPLFDEVWIAQAARMQSGEINLRYWVDMPPGPFDVSLLVGARWMQIDDRFRLVTSLDDTISDDVLSETDNTLVGVQIGIAGDFLIHPRFWLNVDLKGGIYNNETSLSLQGLPDQDLITGEAQRTAFVGDISIVGHWQLTPWLVFNLGYQATFVEGLALGARNVANPPFLDGIDDPPTTQFDDSGRLVYHGPVIGLMGVW